MEWLVLYHHRGESVVALLAPDVRLEPDPVVPFLAPLTFSSTAPSSRSRGLS